MRVHALSHDASLRQRESHFSLPRFHFSLTLLEGVVTSPYFSEVAWALAMATTTSSVLIRGISLFHVVICSVHVIKRISNEFSFHRMYYETHFVLYIPSPEALGYKTHDLFHNASYVMKIHMRSYISMIFSIPSCRCHAGWLWTILRVYQVCYGTERIYERWNAVNTTYRLKVSTRSEVHWFISIKYM